MEHVNIHLLTDLTARKRGTAMLKRIHINQWKIKLRVADPIAVQTSKGVHSAAGVEIQGPSQLIYSPDKPLKCGAHLWIETKAPVLIDQAVLLE